MGIRISPSMLADLIARGAVLGPPAVLPTGTLAPHAPREGTSEKDFTAAVIAAAQERGWVVAHFRAVRVQRKDGSVFYETPVQADGKGWPDLFMVRTEPRPGLLVAELKVGKNKTSPEQDTWLSAFRAVGVPAFVWTPTDWESIVATLGQGAAPPQR